DKSACCVIVASGGYPASYPKGKVITIDDSVSDSVYVAGASIVDGDMVTSGGRVLGVTAVSDTLENAIKCAYDKVTKVDFEGAYFRHDIGQKALRALEAK
ncbi:MAG: phosphoribosylamine--glycine ligase, partial [Clostridia bacterium]|nr:phosphoribosylamine--glycine ligase [Clostridia bacterium]